MTHLLPGNYSYDQVQIGDHFDTATAQITPAMIVAFANLTGDHFAIHLSDQGAAAHGFTAQIAHGLLVLSLVEGLKSNAAVQFATYAALGWDWTFHRPVLAGDSIKCTITVTAKRAASAKSGILTLSVDVQNQHGHRVQSGQTRLMSYRDKS